MRRIGDWTRLAALLASAATALMGCGTAETSTTPPSSVANADPTTSSWSTGSESSESPGTPLAAASPTAESTTAPTAPTVGPTTADTSAVAVPTGSTASSAAEASCVTGETVLWRPPGGAHPSAPPANYPDAPTADTLVATGFAPIARFEWPATDSAAVYAMSAWLAEQTGARANSADQPSPEQAGAVSFDSAPLTCAIALSALPAEAASSELRTACTATHAGFDYGAFECNIDFEVNADAISRVSVLLVKARFADQRSDILTGTLLLGGARVFQPTERCARPISIESFVDDSGAVNPWFGVTAAGVAFTGVEPELGHPLTVALCNFSGPIGWAPVSIDANGSYSLLEVYDTPLAACEAVNCVIDG